MMHNSLLIADRLREANRNPLHRGRRDPHRTLRRLPVPQTAEPGFLSLVGSWTVEASQGEDGAQAAAEDFVEFLERIGVDVSNSPGSPGGRFRFLMDPSVPGNAFRLLAETARIEIRAADNAGIWAGAVYLERQITGRGRTEVPLGDSLHRPSWQTQISQAPFGSNYLVPDLSEEYLSDDAFRLLAHYGVNGMTVYGDWLCYVRSERYPELDPSKRPAEPGASEIRSGKGEEVRSEPVLRRRQSQIPGRPPAVPETSRYEGLADRGRPIRQEDP